MAKETGKKKFTVEEALIVLCSEDYSCSESSNSDDEDNLDKLSQNSSVSSDQITKLHYSQEKKFKIQIIEKVQNDYGQVQNHQYFSKSTRLTYIFCFSTEHRSSST